MYCEIPRLLRCCFCVPLRCGILMFGYLNILFSILMIVYLSYTSYHTHRFLDYTHLTVPVHGVVLWNTHFAISLTIYSLEFIFNMVLIVGSHKKNIMLMKVFYYYELSTMVAVLLMFFIQLYEIILISGYTTLFFASLAFAGLVLRGYMTILVKSEITKLENNQQFQFINHAAEAVIEKVPTDAIYRRTTEQLI